MMQPVRDSLKGWGGGGGSYGQRVKARGLELGLRVASPRAKDIARGGMTQLLLLRVQANDLLRLAFLAHDRIFVLSCDQPHSASAAKLEIQAAGSFAG